MLGHAPALLAAAVLSAGAVEAVPDGGAPDVALWDHRAVARTVATVAPPAADRATRGACDLARVDRAAAAPLRCIGCHDAAASASHPLVDYASVALRDPERFVPPARLAREVPLVGGKIACTSCHDGASRDPKHVAIAARLCESCHRL